MNEVFDFLSERKNEFKRHLSIARMLERRIAKEIEDGDEILVDIRHVNTIKSGLLIHLYNIVEAITTKTLAIVGQTVVTEKPRVWTEAVLKEWVRAAVWSGEERIDSAALNRLTQICSTLVSGNNVGAFVVKSEPGSWDDDAIRRVAVRLGCELALPPDVRKAAYERAYRNESTALRFLARSRNAIAHGDSTFEEGAKDLTLDQLEELAERVLPFLEAVSKSYQAFLENKGYLTEEEVNA